MLLINHALTGLTLGFVIDNPAELVAAGVGSHLVQDSLPHFWFGYQSQPLFILVGSIDFAGAAIVTTAACLARPDRALHLLVGVISAATPDLIYIPELFFSRIRLEHLIPGFRAVRRFLERIQWYERPPGLIVEVVWAALMLRLILIKL